MKSREEFYNKKMEEILSFPPTSSQKQLFSTLASFTLADPLKNWLLVVSGYAGTGKTSALAAYITLLKRLRKKYILLAPTGRSAKVLQSFTGEKTSTIHKCIYRQKSITNAIASFALDYNKSSDTIYIVDEVSLLSGGDDSESIFGSGNTLDDLFLYVRNNDSNKLILVGDPAQLPPIGFEKSPALDPEYLYRYTSDIALVHLSDVVRQANQSGILFNATKLREQIESENLSTPHFDVKNFTDVQSINGGELIEEISNAIDKYGVNEVVVLCRSNIRANRYNLGIRNQILFFEEQLQKGDRVMVVKNCYQFDGKKEDLDFIANGDVATVVKLKNFQERYGLHFADATLLFTDYNDAKIEAKIILDTLESQSASLDREKQIALYEGVSEDYSSAKSKRERYKMVREDPFYNALQLKYSAAITGHKSQGGQWACVFIDNILWKDEVTLDDKKWLYTAITRGVEKVFFVNFPSKCFE